MTLIELDMREGPEKSDIEVVHQWLASSYWQPGVSRERVMRAAENSAFVLNAFFQNRQVGYLRVISDFLTFAWIADVMVEEEFRGRGVARAMLEYSLQHEVFRELNRWTLATSDAHGLYEKFGFTKVNPGVMMHRLDPEYQRLTGF